MRTPGTVSHACKTARWQSMAPRPARAPSPAVEAAPPPVPGVTPEPTPLDVAPPLPVLDAGELLEAIARDLARTYPAVAVGALLAPLREAAQAPAAKRDAAAVARALDRVEDVIDATLLLRKAREVRP